MTRAAGAAVLIALIVTMLPGCAPTEQALTPVEPAPEKDASRPFEAFRRHLDSVGLDVMIVFDATGSMEGTIAQLQHRLDDVENALTAVTSNARLGLVAYRDLKRYVPDNYEYTVKYVPLQKLDRQGRKKLAALLAGIDAGGGGDVPDAVYEGLETAIKRSGWNPESRRVIVLVGDAPPRPEFSGNVKVFNLVKGWHEAHGGIVTCIDTSGNSRVMAEFKEIARVGGGQAVFINDEGLIARKIVIAAFGDEWPEQIDDVCDRTMRAGKPDGE